MAVVVQGGEEGGGEEQGEVAASISMDMVHKEAAGSITISV
jgi:hypothetical protein